MSRLQVSRAQCFTLFGFLDGLVYFFAVDRYFFGCFDTQFDLVSADFNNDNPDVVVDDDRFVLLSGQYQHAGTPLPGYILFTSTDELREVYPAMGDKVNRAFCKKMTDFSDLQQVFLPRRTRLNEAFREMEKLEKVAMTAIELVEARSRVDTDPSEAQKDSGTYRKGHLAWQGLNITIENPKGSTRSGTSADGKSWSQKMKNDYGYFKGSVGKDKDHVDVFIGPDLDSELVFVVNQLDVGTQKFDEHKCVICTTNEAQARKTYLDNYEAGWQGLGSVKAMIAPDFKKWVLDHAKTRKEAGDKAKAKEEATDAGRDGASGDGGLDSFFDSPPNKTGRRCPGCGELFKECEPLADVTTCETCERFGEPKTAEDKELSSLLSQAELMGSRGRARMYGRPEPEDRDYDHVLFTDNVERQQLLMQQLRSLAANKEYKTHDRPGGFLTVSGDNQDISVYPTSKRDDIHKSWSLQEGGLDKNKAWKQVELEKIGTSKHVPTVAVDLDGTLAIHYDEFDEDHIPGPRPGAKKWMQKFKDAGARVIINTVRGKDSVTKAWLKEHDIPYDYLNENPDQPEGSSDKILADVYLDDRAISAAGRLASSAPEVLERLKTASDSFRTSDPQEVSLAIEILRQSR